MDIRTEIDAFIAEHRDACLWWLRPDWTPTTDDQRRQALGFIRHHGTRVAWMRAKELGRALDGV
jgi:hypothetical protein